MATRVMLSVSEEFYDDLSSEAARQDRARTWLVQKAWVLARAELAKLPTAARPPPPEPQRHHNKLAAPLDLVFLGRCEAYLKHLCPELRAEYRHTGLMLVAAQLGVGTNEQKLAVLIGMSRGFTMRRRRRLICGGVWFRDGRMEHRWADESKGADVRGFDLLLDIKLAEGHIREDE